MTCFLAPFPHAPTSFDNTLVFAALHPKLDGYVLKYYKLNQEFELSSNSFKLAF